MRWRPGQVVGLGAVIGVIILVAFFSWYFGWWPVACTTRGCVTAKAWAEQQELARKFAAFAGQEEPHPNDTLTTLLRQHLVRKAPGFSASSIGDAKRYREEVLQLTNEDLVGKATGVDIDVYDEKVLLPLLEQEGLRQQTQVESLDELFVQLSGQRRIWVLLNDARWDPQTARLVRK